RMRHASCTGMFHDVSLHIGCGEIVGLGGLLGAGRSELARAIYGLYRLTSGRMELSGRRWSPVSPQQALKQGVVYLPEERKRQGLVLDHSILDSVGIGVAEQVWTWGWIQRNPERRRVQSVLDRYGVRTQSLSQPVGTLSGGNQQKLLLGRWLDRDPRFVILDEPTRGVDVAAKAQIHSVVKELASRGQVVLLISSDLPELVSLSHRIVVLNRGAVVATLSGAAMTEQAVFMAASGGEPDSARSQRTSPPD
ncbi:MAG: ATP-binding cassette domain-containing protein, partial [Planctomycetaceae bacterium]